MIKTIYCCKNEITSRARRDYVSCPTRLRLVVTLLLMLCVNMVWGQTDTDYSGTYYIASNDDYPTTKWYLLPATVFYDGNHYTTSNGTMPYVTTDDQTGQVAATVWHIMKAESGDYYYVVHNGQYLTLNVDPTKNTDKARLRVHLQDEKDGNNSLFIITRNNSGWYNISPQNESGKSLNPAGNNYSGTEGTSDKQETITGFSGKINVGGLIGLWANNDARSKWQFEDVISAPVITQQNDNTITITYPGEENVTLYYTTDGTKPDPKNIGNNTTQVFNGAFPLTESISIIKAVAVKAKVGEEVLDTYSRVMTFNVMIRLGIDHPYLVQSQENTNYYMIPVTDTNSAGGFTKTNTTTLRQPSMMWYFMNAGSVDGIQYYYMVNKSTGQYVYYHQSGSNYLISIDSSDTFDGADSKDKYCFSINSAEGGGYNICPREASSRCIYKGTSNKHNSYILAYTAKTNALGRWDLISLQEEKMPAVSSPIIASTPDGAVYYSIENEKTPGNYISPATYVTTATSVTDNEKWYFVQADKDNWLTYYYIVNAISGEYLYLNKTGANAVITKTWSEGLDDEDKYRFVLAPSSTGAYYIIPKSQATQETRAFTSLYSNAADPLKTESRRYWLDTNDQEVNARGDDAYIKWTFNEVSLTSCQNVRFSEKDSKIILSSPTFGTKICYTTDGTTPTAATETVFTDETNLSTSNQYLIKAIAVMKNNSDVASELVTLFNKPDVTLSQDTYTYDGTAHEPTVSKVAITISGTEYEAAAATYAIDTYSNNTNAGTATVSLVDNNLIDDIFFGNFAKDFTINVADITPSVTVADWTYGGEASTPVVSGNLDNGTVAYEYKVLGAADKTYTETVPTNAGNYTIRATIAATNNCNAGTATADFTISKAELTATVTIDGWIYGTAAKKPSVTGNTENGTVTYQYKVKDADDDTYTTTVPTNAGSYTIRATIAETTNYNRKQVTTDFIISKADINPTITMEGWTYGETANTPSVKGNTGNGTVTYEYKVKDADDNTYTTTVPTIAGNYTIRATITATANYSGKQVTKDFTISRATITPIVTIANWTYGDVANAPTVTGNTENGTVTYEYKLKDAADNTYTTTVPTDAGHYTLRAAIAGTTNYKGNYAMTNFSINKATFTPIVSMTGWTYGDDANAPEVTGNTSSGAVTYEYKLTSAADATYMTKVPKDAGSYTVQATIAETPNYNGAVATATFTITSKAINTGDAPKAGMTVDFRKNSSGQYVTVLKDNGTTLEEGAAYDYTVTKTETSKYITATITGSNHNYTGSFAIKFAKVNFTKKEGSGTPGGVGTFVTNATGDGNFVTPANMTAYIVTGISGNSVLTEKVDYICEDMPVLLLSTVDADGFIVQLETDAEVLYTDEEKSERVGKNKLEKKSTDWTLTKPEIYLLYKGEFVLNAPGTLEAGKIYLPMPSNASPSPRLAIAWGDVTSIEDGRCEMDDGRSEHWYTLDGRRINGKPVTKGLYIVNGKKVVIK